jgi:hypothetical protein
VSDQSSERVPDTSPPLRAMGRFYRKDLDPLLYKNRHTPIEAFDILAAESSVQYRLIAGRIALGIGLEAGYSDNPAAAQTWGSRAEQVFKDVIGDEQRMYAGWVTVNNAQAHYWLAQAPPISAMSFTQNIPQRSTREQAYHTTLANSDTFGKSAIRRYNEMRGDEKPRFVSHMAQTAALLLVQRRDLVEGSDNESAWLPAVFSSTDLHQEGYVPYATGWNQSLYSHIGGRPRLKRKVLVKAFFNAGFLERNPNAPDIVQVNVSNDLDTSMAPAKHDFGVRIITTLAAEQRAINVGQDYDRLSRLIAKWTELLFQAIG